MINNRLQAEPSLGAAISFATTSARAGDANPHDGAAAAQRAGRDWDEADGLLNRTESDSRDLSFIN